MDHYKSVSFSNFKAFKKFKLDLRAYNILVGPNNAGKSTILIAFRILSAAIRKAKTRRAQPLNARLGFSFGFDVDLASISIAEENIFHNYDETEIAKIHFLLEKSKELILVFPEQSKCYLIALAGEMEVETPSQFKKFFDCDIGFVPILGPVDHHEHLYNKEAARLALFNFGAARNFRNIWYHKSEEFESFRQLLLQTWPGMDIEMPKVEIKDNKPILYMFCPENRIPRELFWSGFGFQVWCQMLTHLIQSRMVSLFLIDEPDIYLHAELQRQLINILRDLGPDILIATHSTEIITEADAGDILIVNKENNAAKRVRTSLQLQEVFKDVGSILNPTWTQLAKTRRVLFVEGEDFKILSRIARIYNIDDFANRRNFAVISLEGFNPQKVKILKEGIEAALGIKILSAVIFDRDYRCDMECNAIESECKTYCDFALIHSRKEVENYALDHVAIAMAFDRRAKNQAKRTGKPFIGTPDLKNFLIEYAKSQKSVVYSRMLSERKRYEREIKNSFHEATIAQLLMEELDSKWIDEKYMLQVIGGKSALTALNEYLGRNFGLSLNENSIIDCLSNSSSDDGMKKLVGLMKDFVCRSIPT